MRELQQARELPITLIELTTEVLPKLKNVDVTLYNGWLVTRDGDEYTISQSWSFNSRTGEYIQKN